MGRVVNVCISEKKGTQKHPIDEGEFIVEFGVKDVFLDYKNKFNFFIIL